MVFDLQSLFGPHVTLCTQLHSLAETPQPPPPPHIWTRIQMTSLYDPLDVNERVARWWCPALLAGI
jgi:hypothetical protein